MILSHLLVFAIFFHNVWATQIVENNASLNFLNNLKAKTSNSLISNFYVTIPGIGRHKFHKEQKTWNEARNICLNEGAHLAVFKSAQEESILIQRMRDLSLSQVWIGIRELFAKDDWISIQHQRLSSLGHINWAEGEPNNYLNRSEHCVVAHGGGWNDMNCDWTASFLCKL